MFNSIFTFKNVLSGVGLDNKRLANFVELVSQPGYCLSFFKQAIKAGYVSMPHPYEGSEIYCVQTVFYKKHTVQVFVDVRGDVCCLLFQANYFVASVYLVKEDALLYQTRRPDFYRSGIDFLFSSGLVDQQIIKENVDHHGVKRKLYLINGYRRPLHYFLDRMPESFSVVKNTDIDVLTVGSEAFVSGAFLGAKKDFTFRSEVLLENYLSESFSVGFWAANESFVTPSKKVEKLEGFLSTASFDVKKKEGDFWLWVGCCQEKRRLVNLPDVVEALYYFISNALPGKRIKLLFDGLTRPVSMGKKEFESSCLDELLLENLILKKIPNVDFVSLIGALAEEKISYAKEVDFFISNALTDSMWTATFFEKPGVAYASHGASLILQRHTNTFLVPDECIYTLPTDKGWSHASMEINIPSFKDFLMEINF